MPSGSISQFTTWTSGPASRLGAFPAAALAARGAVEAATPPASRNRPNRIACQLIDKEHFDHGGVRRPHNPNGAASAEENAACVASAMQFFRGLRDHASLIARARQLVL